MKRILVVDDAAFIRESLKQMLKKNGYEIAGEAENGEMAVKKYIELHPDLVTMDITMPEMDGVAALKKIRQLDSNSKVIMISALGQESHVREAVLEGARGFIVKPFKEQHVIDSIAKILV